MRVRDKRGLDIEVGDTLIAGCGEGELKFIEVEHITEHLVVGRDYDDVTYAIEDAHNYVSVCACYRDAQ